MLIGATKGQHVMGMHIYIINAEVVFANAFTPS